VVRLDNSNGIKYVALIGLGPEPDPIGVYLSISIYIYEPDPIGIYLSIYLTIYIYIYISI
jgi:hypothetical protein